MAVTRYSHVAIALHWMIAICVIALVPMGWWMTDAVNDPAQQQSAYRAFQLHKSLGLAVLVLTLMRLGWRLTHPVPSLPASMKLWEKLAAHGVHASFYGLLLALPLTGWLYVSSGWSADTDQPLAVATSWFGLFSVPHLPGVAEASQGTRRIIAFGAMGAHSLMALGAAILVALHVGAALKHQFVDRDGVLGLMLPFLRRAGGEAEAVESGTPAWIFPVGAVAALGLGVVGWFAAIPTGEAPVAPRAETAVNEAVAVASPIDISVQPGSAQAWAIDRKKSSIVFSGTHAGSPFEGHFEDWEGHVWFDPADLAGSRAVVLVRTASAKTGDATQEGSLGQSEWFDPGKFPVARFDADSFVKLPDGRFKASGKLQIKTSNMPVDLVFSFTPNGDSAVVEGKVALDRTRLDLGMASDAGAQWVSKMIDVTLSVTAKRQ